MAKRGSIPVHTRKPKGTVIKDGKMHIGTIGVDEQRKMRKAQERLDRIASGVRSSGSGYHGGGKRDANRRQRREGKRDASDF